MWNLLASPGAVLVLVGFLLAGCASTKGSAIPTGPQRFTPTRPDVLVETYLKDQTPSRPYEQLGIVRGRYRAPTAWSTADISDVLPELHARARELGADAIVITDVQRFLGPALNPLYRTIPNVEATAIAIRYVSTPAPRAATVALASSAAGVLSLPDAIERVAP